MLDMHARRRRTARRHLVLVAVLVAVVVVVGIVIAVGVSSGGGGGSAASAPGSSPSRPSPSPSASASTAAADVVVLPRPGRVVHGVPMGFPDTTDGAVSAAAHYFEVLDLLDPTAADQQARVIAQPGFEAAMGLQAQAGAQRLRSSMGLPADGTSDAGNYYARQARSFRVVNGSASRVTVWLLMDDTVSAKGVSSSSTSVQGAVMVWAGGDWRMSVLQQMGTAPAAVTPGGEQARQEGWQSLAYASK